MAPLPPTADWWERSARFFLILFAAALPHSIALAQALAGAALLLWAGGQLARRQRPARTPLDAALLFFVLVTILAAVFSLEPSLSVSKLSRTALVLLAPLAAGLLASRRQALVLLAVLLASAGAGAAVVLAEKAFGRGVDVVEIARDSPLRGRVRPHDVLLQCDGQTIRNPVHFDRLLREHDRTRPLRCEGMRAGLFPFAFKLSPKRFPEKPGPETWGYQVKVGRGLRAHGTYSHPVTYAEVLLQLTALLGGLWLACPRKAGRAGAALLLAGLLLAAALAATFTRASWAALVVAGLAMLWMRLGWRGRIAVLVAAAVALVGLNVLLVKWRGVGFYDPGDTSMQYRRVMWEDGWRLIREYPLLGIGMDSVLTRWPELGIRAYQQFGLVSHFHSTPIQIGVERGLLGLAAWLLLMTLYVRLLCRLIARTRAATDWWEHGLALGLFGAAVGFLSSGLVHYNFGDSEVVMVFWLLAGVALALDRLGQPTAPDAAAKAA